MPNINLRGNKTQESIAGAAQQEAMKSAKHRGALDVSRIQAERDIKTAITGVERLAKAIGDIRKQLKQNTDLELKGSMRVFRMKQDEQRQEERDLRNRQQMRKRFWQDIAVGGLVGSIGGGGGLSGLARFGGAVAGGGLAYAAGAGKIGAGLAAEVAGELASLLVNPMHSAYSAASPYFNYQRQAYSLGRAYGIRGASMTSSFFPAAYKAAPWMSKLDMTPEEALQSLMQFGIAPQGSPGGLVQAMRRVSLTGGFNLLAPNAVQGIMRQGVGMGLATGSGAGASSYLAPFERIVQDAVAQGMDQSRLVGAMQSSLETLAKMGVAGASPSSIAGLIRQLAFTGTPGGLTGSSAVQAVGGTLSSLRGFMSNGPLSAALFSVLPKYGNLKTTKDVEKFIGPAQWRALESSKGAAFTGNIMKQITSAASAGNLPIALDFIFQDLAGGNPRLMLNMLGPALQSMSGGNKYLYGKLASSMLPGVSRSTLDQLIYGGRAPRNISQGLARYNAGHNWASHLGYAHTVEGIYGGAFGSVQGGFDAKTNYIQMLLKQGISPNLAAMFITAGHNTGTNPLLLASIAAHESGGNSLANIGRYAGEHWNKGHKTFDYGIMQVNSANLANFPGAGPGGTQLANIMAGAKILRGDLFGASGRHLDLPQHAVTARVTAAVGDLTAAMGAGGTLVPVMQTLNGTMRDLTQGVKGLTKAITGKGGGGRYHVTPSFPDVVGSLLGLTNP